MAGQRNKKVELGELQQSIIQAVVIADSFNVRFAPLSNETPRVLLPLVNRPMLDYTLEYLLICGVEEVFVLCCAHANQIKEYLRNSEWCSESSQMSVSAIVSEDYLSLGDTMRELDAKGLIRSDFILISGDVISNLPLVDILAEHKKNTERDKGCIMTLVHRKLSPNHRTKCHEDDIVVCIDPNTSRILFYQKTASSKKLLLPKDLLQEHQDLILRHNLLDSQITICSKHVPALFVDNFDFQTRDDFIKWILINEEILSNSIYLSLAETGYAAQASNLYMYDSISRDIIQRWTYPVVPDMSIGNPYLYLRHNVYRQNNVELARTSDLEKNVVIGMNTKIGNNTIISNSVIGKNCVIGDNVTIHSSYLWNNVAINNNCKLTNCLLANNVTLKKGCTISPGVILANKVIIGPNVTLEKGSAWVAKPCTHQDLFEDESEEKILSRLECEKSLVGLEGVAYPFAQEVENESDGEEISPVLQKWGVDQGSEGDEGEDSSQEDSQSEGDSREISPIPDDMRLFYNEVLDSLQRGVEEKIKCDNLVLEVNSSKYAYNMTMKEVNMLVIKAILEIPAQKSATLLTTQEYTKAIDPLFKQLLPLIKNYIRSVESQNDCLFALEEFSLGNAVFAPVLMKVLKFLYDADVIEEDVLLKWYKNLPEFSEFAVEQQMELRKRLQRLIEWLQEADEESDSSSG